MASALRFGPLGPSAVHLCIDMQTLFAERTDGHVPSLERVLPAVVRLAETQRGQTVFTLLVNGPSCGGRLKADSLVISGGKRCLRPGSRHGRR